MMDQLCRVSVQAIVALGRAVSWLLLLLTLLCFGNVVMRSGWSVGWVALQELVLQAHAAALMLAAPWVLLVDEHVRVDIWYQKQRAARRLWVDRLGTLLLLCPVCALFVWASLDYVLASIRVLEGSPEAGGLPGLFLIKALIPVVFVLIGIAGVLKVTTRHQEPGTAAPEHEAAL